MDHKAAATADALELLHMNQRGLRASVEEIVLWFRARCSENTFGQTIVALQKLDANTDAVASAIVNLRSMR